MSQLSIASPSSANSPSPVDRDCSGLQKNWTNEFRSQQNPQYYSSMSPSTSDSRSGSPTKSVRVFGSSMSMDHYNVKTCGQFGGSSVSLQQPHSSKSFPSCDIPSVKISQTAHGHSNHRRPQMSKIGFHQPSKDSYGLVKPSTYEQRPASCHKPAATCNKTTTKNSPQDRSSVERKHITLSIQQKAAISPMESLTPSPSRERINSLVACLTSTLCKAHHVNGADTPSVLSQELSEKVAESVHLTREQLDSLVQLALASPTEAKPNQLVSEVPYVTTASVDHPAEALREVGLNIEDHPRDVRMGEPADGYMSVLFNLRPCHVIDDGTTNKRRNEVVKV